MFVKFCKTLSLIIFLELDHQELLERLIFILKSHLKIDLRSVRVLGQNLKYVHVEYDISEGITAAKLKKTTI